MEDSSSPSWLNEDFLASVLEGAEILKFSVKPAVAAGNNYFSDLYRACVHFKSTPVSKEDVVSLIIKAPVQRGMMTEVSASTDFYATEPLVYTQLLPFIKDRIHFDIGPKSYYCSRESTLVLEDLAEEGYVMANKYDQLDFHHCKIVLESLAKFHATSVVCFRENPKLIEAIAEEKLYSKDELQTQMWLDFCMKRLAEIVNKMDVRQSTKDFVHSRLDNIWESSIEMCSPKTDCLKVLNHGDCWTNNILFKHSESGDVVGVKLIDFQFSRFTSPILDLITFFLSSPNRDVREHKEQELYCFYIETLNETFEKLQCEERFTHEDLQNGMITYLDWILVVLSFDLPFFLSKPEDTVDYSEEGGESIFSDPRTLRLHQGQYYTAVLPELVLKLESLLEH